MTDLVAIARSLFAPGKGILAADESVHTATERLAEHGIATSEEMRRQYRNLFINAESIEQHLSGVILFSDCLVEKGNNRTTFPLSLASRGILPGVKVDLGTEAFPASPQELITNGLLDLPERLLDYKKQGAVFAKWRAVFRIEGDHLPTAQAIHENVKRLATYAKEVQMAGLVPVLEPEVLMEGKHSRQKTATVMKEVLSTLFTVLDEQAIDRASVVLKVNMVISGEGNEKKDTPEEVAQDTIEVLLANVPRQIAGVAFLSGGQSPDQATDNLAAIMKAAQAANAPWPLTFSYARALQNEALAVWNGKEENVTPAREAFLSRLTKLSAVVA